MSFFKDYEAISLRASQSFCKIAARVQERLATQDMTSLDEIYDFDKELTHWWADLHPLFRDTATIPESVRTARGLLRCRFWTTRLTLYRPYLLHIILKEKSSALSVTVAEQELITTCGNIALETAATIAGDWFPNQLSAWHSVWHIFQAALVLLVALLGRNDVERLDSLNLGIRTIVDALDSMQRWGTGATRSLEVIQLLYARVNARLPDSGASTPQDLFAEQDYISMLDQILDGDTEWFDYESI